MQATEAGFRDGASADVEGGGGGEGEGVSHSDGSLGNLKTDSDTSSSTTTKTGMRLVELNGTRGGPIDRSECEDLLRVRRRIFFLCYVGLTNITVRRIRQSM